MRSNDATVTRPVRRRRASDEDTRSGVIAAALETICARGFYQASSNEIARHANVSWGVIQYHFGSREALLIAVLDDAVDRALESLASIRIVGNDRRMKLRQLLNHVLSFYGTSQYAAVLQILWNLARDSQTEESTEAAVIRHAKELNTQWHELLAEVVEDEVSDEAVWMAFTLMWGVAMEQAAASYMNQGVVEATRLPIEYRIEMTLDALEGLLCNKNWQR